MSRGPKPRPAIERWERLVIKVDDGCWLWTGATQAGGYGRFFGEDRKAVLVHRWTYEHFVGPIPDGLTIDHLCRNTSCVNPDHLEPVTREVNAHRGNPNAGKTHCTNGHEFTPENTYVPPKRPGVRACRACRKADSAARYQRIDGAA